MHEISTGNKLKFYQDTQSGINKVRTLLKSQKLTVTFGLIKVVKNQE